MRRTEIQRKFDEIVAFAEVDKFIDTPVKHYSSGMYVRLAFAVAAHLEPEILLVDEVLAVGDAAFQKKCLGKMGDVASEGRTVLFVSHNMAAVQQLCGVGVLLASGRRSQIGPIEDVCSKYLAAPTSGLSEARELHNDTRRQGEGVLFRFTRATLVSPGPFLQLWEPLHVRFDFEVGNISGEVVPGISVTRLDGTVVFTAESDDTGQAIDGAADSSGSVEVTIQHPNLAPGRYSIRLGARSGGRILDLVHGALVFDVLEAPSLSRTQSQGHLGMRPESQWRVAVARPLPES